MKKTFIHLPIPAQLWLPSLAESKRQVDKAKSKERAQIWLEDLLAQLEGFALRGDAIFHSLLSNIGKFDCSPQQSVAAFAERLCGLIRTLLAVSASAVCTSKIHLDHPIANF